MPLKIWGQQPPMPPLTFRSRSASTHLSRDLLGKKHHANCHICKQSRESAAASGANTLPCLSYSLLAFHSCSTTTRPHLSTTRKKGLPKTHDKHSAKEFGGGVAVCNCCRQCWRCRCKSGSNSLPCPPRESMQELRANVSGFGAVL